MTNKINSMLKDRVIWGNIRW